MRFAVAEVSTRDTMLGQYFEECCHRKAAQAPAPAPVSMKLLNKLRIERMLEELEQEYDNRI